MINSCIIQKNVNMTIKDGLKKIRDLVAAIEINHKIARGKVEWYQRGLIVNEELRQDRRKPREKIQRPPPEDSSPKNRPFKKLNKSKSR